MAFYPNPNHNSDDQTSVGRIFLVIVLSIGFFAAYMYFFPPKENPKTAPATQTNKVLDSENSDFGNVQNSSQAHFQNLNSQNVPNIPPQNTIALKDSLLLGIQSEYFDIEIDALGRISQVYLKDEKFTTNEQQSLFSIIGGLFGIQNNEKKIEKLPLFSGDDLKTLELRFENAQVNARSFTRPYSLYSEDLDSENGVNILSLDSAKTITLTQDLGEFENYGRVIVTKTITFNTDLTYSAQISVNNPNLDYFVSNGMRPNGDSDSYVFRGVILKNADGSIEKIEDGDAVAEQSFPASAFLASVDRYYTSLFFRPDGVMDVVIYGNRAHNPMPALKARGATDFVGYIGPKDYKTLLEIDQRLGEVVEYGMITFFARWIFWLLAWLYELCGNWGWAIVLLTIVVRIILYPLTYKGMMSMQKLKDIAPKMKEIQDKYKGDPQKMQVHMMELYKKHGANPLGGCLPLLLQIPVFFAIYRVLYNAIELKNSEWILWIHDLSAIDPYFVLPVLMGVSMYVTQCLTPSNFNDPMQEKIFKMLPWFFMIFFIIFPFPAGLVLYWTINNVFSIIQQLSINAVLKRRKEKQLAHKQ